jgi:hypothetical protein
MRDTGEETLLQLRFDLWISINGQQFCGRVAQGSRHGTLLVGRKVPHYNTGQIVGSSNFYEYSGSIRIGCSHLVGLPALQPTKIWMHAPVAHRKVGLCTASLIVLEIRGGC